MTKNKNMSHPVGILFALGAMFGWALGDFSIQRATRAVGTVRALFYISVLGGVGLLPFIWNEFVPSFHDFSGLPILVLAGLLLSFTALANFEGLKKGKLSVVLPMNGIELIVTVGLAVGLGHERYPNAVYGLIFLVFLGLALTTMLSVKNLKKIAWEKGAFWALMGAFGLGASNYTIGLSSRAYSPLFTIWFTSIIIAIFAAFIMLKRGTFARVRQDFKNHFPIIATQSFLDNLAWISYAFATVSIPIGIATTISEGYLALGTLLGVVINKEKLKKHQYFGITVTISGVLALGWLTG